MSGPPPGDGLDVAGWQARLRRFVEERNWQQFQTPKNLAMALSGEVAEVVELFCWLTPEESEQIMSTDAADDVRDEIADVLSYLLMLADRLQIDLDAALAAKVPRNEQRYPPSRAITDDGPDRPR